MKQRPNAMMRHGIALAALLLAALGTPRPAAALEDGIIAIVNEDVITMKDLQDYLNARFVQLRMEGRSKSQISHIMADLEVNGIQQLIQDRLILTEANRIGLLVRDELVDEKLTEIKSKYTSEQEFLEALFSDGATVTDLRKKILEQLKMKYIVEHSVKSKIFVNPQEVTEYYNNHMAEFVKPERLKLNSIYIALGEDPANARLRAEHALTLIQAGEDFVRVALQFSEAPPIGTIEKGKMLKEIEREIFALNEGETSGLIEVPGGFYIFLLDKRLKAQIAPLGEVKEEISKIIFNEKMQKKFLSWIDQLKKKAFIEIKR